MESPKLDWSAAEVKDATLTVQVLGEPDDEWAQTFARTLILLSSDADWGPAKFKAKSGTVKVDGIREGSEGNVRFALDGAVQEANAHRAALQDGESSDGDADEPTDKRDDPDARMTERFRGE